MEDTKDEGGRTKDEGDTLAGVAGVLWTLAVAGLLLWGCSALVAVLIGG